MKPKKPASRQEISSIAVGAAIAVLVCAGAGHRLLAHKIDALLADYLRPKEPLGTLPLGIGPWNGHDAPVDERVREKAGDDDYLNRVYSDANGQTLTMYVGYQGRPRTRMGHRPDVCYPAHGYKELQRESIELVSMGGLQVPALLHDFASPTLGAPQQLVVAMYIVNGEFVSDTKVVNTYNTRGPSLFSAPRAYNTRIQIAVQATGDRAADTALLRDFAARIIDPIRSMMPGDEHQETK